MTAYWLIIKQESDQIVVPSLLASWRTSQYGHRTAKQEKQSQVERSDARTQKHASTTTSEKN
jgi:hypothetical protein